MNDGHKKYVVKAGRAAAIVFAAVLGSGCHRAALCDHQPDLTEKQVVEIANAAAESSGYQLTRYGAPTARFEYVDDDCTWSVFYEGLSDRTGNHFLIVVDDATRKTTIFGGL